MFACCLLNSCLSRRSKAERGLDRNRVQAGHANSLVLLNSAGVEKAGLARAENSTELGKTVVAAGEFEEAGRAESIELFISVYRSRSRWI